jgi:hypothetical protein
LVIPVDLRKVIGKCELRYTLHTGSRREAAKLSKRIAKKVKPLLAELRRNRISLTQEEIDKIIRDYVRINLEGMDEQAAFERAKRGRPLDKDELYEDVFG